MHGSVSLGVYEPVNKLYDTGAISIETDLNNINDHILNSLFYTSNSSNFNSTDIITIMYSDEGNTGNGGVLTVSDTISINISTINNKPTLTLSDSTLLFTEGDTVGQNFSVTVYDMDCISIDCSTTIELTSSTAYMTPHYCTDSLGTSAVKSLTLTGTISLINTCFTDIMVTFPTTSYGMFGQEIEISFNDNGERGYGSNYLIKDYIMCNVTQLPIGNTVTVTFPSSNYTINQYYSLPIFSELIVGDTRYSSTGVKNYDLLTVNITSINDNYFSLYSLKGIHLTTDTSKGIKSNNYYDSLRTQRYQTNIIFDGIMFNLNYAFKYIYYHALNNFCGIDIIYIDIQYPSQSLTFNDTLNINVTC